MKKVSNKVIDLREDKDKSKLVMKDKKEAVAEKNEEILQKKSKKVLAGAVTKKEVAKTKVEDVAETKEDAYELGIGLEEMLKAGCHLGHKISKTNPKVTDYLYGKKDGIAVVDLPKSYADLQKACAFVHQLAKEGKTILFLGTKRSAREVVRRVAGECGMPFVSNRWPGGAISNWEQIRKSIKSMNETASRLEKGVEGATKKEISVMRKNLVRTQTMFGGMSKVEKMFDAMFVVDITHEKTALKEAKLHKIPIVALVDTDSNPGLVDYPIVVNDDSVKSVTLIVEEVGRAIANKK